jgi:hypothetical protein
VLDIFAANQTRHHIGRTAPSGAFRTCFIFSSCRAPNRKPVQKVLVTQFRRFGVNRAYLGRNIYKNRFDAQAAKSLSVFYLLIELLETVETDLP